MDPPAAYSPYLAMGPPAPARPIAAAPPAAPGAPMLSAAPSPCPLPNALVAMAPPATSAFRPVNYQAATASAAGNPTFVPCKCRNSKCLKRYCVCFERGEACAAGCRCVGCGNVDGTAARATALQAKKKRKKVSGSGCTCTRSRCLKRYCDCFAAGEKCARGCRCLDCGNLAAPAVAAPAPAAAPFGAAPAFYAPAPPAARAAPAAAAAAAAPRLVPVPIAPRDPAPVVAPIVPLPPLACFAEAADPLRFLPIAHGQPKLARAVTSESGDGGEDGDRRSQRSVLAVLDPAAPRGPRKLASATFSDPGGVGLLLEHVDGSDAIVVTSVAAQGPAAETVPVGARLATINGTDVTKNVDFDEALRLCHARPLTLAFLEPL